MPAAADHISQAQQNEAFVADLKSGPVVHCGWVVTGLFYSALHRVSALLHHRGCSDSDIDGHAKRARQLQQKLDAETQLYSDYRQLKDDSEAARYDCRPFSHAEVSTLEAEEFARIKSRAQELMGL
jgi:hypothetical protein